MRRSVFFQIILCMGLSSLAFAQTSKYRILYPPHATTSGVSADGPVQAGASGSSNLFPAVGGKGWQVDMGNGALSMVVPIAAVPGEIPVPLVFRFNATSAYPVVKAQTYDEVLNKYVNHFTNYYRPVFGSIDFGFISSGDVQYIQGTGTVPGKLDKFTQTSFYVLEDGSVYSTSDFSIMSGTFSLPPNFGFGSRSASSVFINSAGTLVYYPASSTDLGSWAATASSLAPGGFTAGTHTGYQVVMDRDRARVYAYAQELFAWIPILWVDRFGHWVGFQWQNTTSGLPSGFSAVRSVKVLNHRNKGVQVQWAVPSTLNPNQVLLRADFINMEAPTLQLTGYSGPNTTDLAMQPLAGGPVLRPTQLQIGNPAMTAPSWIQLPVPAQVDSEPWPANDLTWSFSYTTNLDEVTGFTDSLGLTTTLAWANTSLVDPYASAQVGSYLVDQYRSVLTATSADSGVTLTRNWTWSLPATTTASSWITTYSQTLSGTQNWLPTPASVGSATVPTLTYSFAPPGDAKYGNGVANTITTSAGATTLSTKTFTYATGIGLDGSLQARQQTTITTMGAPDKTIALTLDAPTGSPTSQTNSAGGAGGTYQESLTYTYDRHPEFLDPNRLVTVYSSRSYRGVSSPNPVRNTTDYDPGTFNPIRQYVDMLTSGKIGKNFSYATSGNTNGHLTGVSNFGTGSIFTSSGTATQTLTLDPTTAMPTSSSVTYDGPVVTGCANSYSSQNYSYDSADRRTSFIDEIGLSNTISYDGRGRVISRTKAGTASVSISYPSEIEMDVAQNGQTAITKLNRLGQSISLRRARDGVTEYYAYDANGRRIAVQEVSPTGAIRTTSQTFDALGRVTTSTPIHGPVVTYSYSPDSSGGQVVSATYSGQTFTTSRTIDLWGNDVQLVDPYGTVTAKQYDSQGHVTSVVVTPSGGTAQTRTFTYNTFGLLQSKNEPETGTITYSNANFNQLGLPLSIVENDGRTRTLTYDGLGRVRAVGNGADSMTSNFNGLQPFNASTMSAGQSTSISYGLDPYGRLQSETITPPFASSAVWSISYGYDSIGRLNSLTYPDGRVIGYTYDDVGNYGKVSAVTAGINGPNIAQVRYDTTTHGWGTFGGLTFASGAANGWLTTADGTQLTSQTISPVGTTPILRPYSYDALNHLTQAGEWNSVTHDNLGRLTQATASGHSIAFAHDGYGNNIHAQAGADPSFNNFTFNPFPSDQTPSTTASGANTWWSYTGDGEARTMGAYVGSGAPQLGFTWDGLGRLSTTVLNGSTSTNAYYPGGLRARLLDSTTPGNNRCFVYTRGGQMLAEYTGSGSSWTWKGDVIYMGSLAIAEIDASGMHELHSDHLGTPIIVTNTSTGISGSQMFGPYGESLPSPYPTGYVPMTGFTGHLQADLNGLIYMRGRFYAPAWHSFLNSDQGVDPFQTNQYGYVSGSPLSLIDPTGMIETQIDGVRVPPDLYYALMNLSRGGPQDVKITAKWEKDGYYKETIRDNQSVLVPGQVAGYGWNIYMEFGPQTNQDASGAWATASTIGSTVSLLDSGLQAAGKTMPGSRMVGPINSTITTVNYLNGNTSGKEAATDIAVDVAIFAATQAVNAETGYVLTAGYYLYKVLPGVWDGFVTTMTPPVPFPH